MKYLEEDEISRYFPGVKEIYIDNVYASEEVILILIKEMLLAGLNYSELPSLVALDATEILKTGAVRTLLNKNNLTLSIIHAGCIFMLQNFDVIVNQPFKICMCILHPPDGRKIKYSPNWGEF